ncbi:hypothetical protein ACFU8I_21920 [Streptomyces sp. NPDC057540]
MRLDLGRPVHALLGGKARDEVEHGAYLFHTWAGTDEPGRRPRPDGHA